MPPITSFPNEILLNIAFYLAPGDVTNLAITARVFVPIAKTFLDCLALSFPAYILPLAASFGCVEIVKTIVSATGATHIPFAEKDLDNGWPRCWPTRFKPITRSKETWRRNILTRCLLGPPPLYPILPANVNGCIKFHRFHQGQHIRPIQIAIINGHLDVVRVLLEAGEDSNGALESLTPIAIANAFQRMDIVKYLVLECDRSLDDIANEPVDSTCTVQAQPKKPWCTWDVAPVWGLNLDLYAGERTIEDIRDRRYKAGRNTYPSE